MYLTHICHFFFVYYIILNENNKYVFVDVKKGAKVRHWVSYLVNRSITICNVYAVHIINYLTLTIFTSYSSTYLT